MSWASMEMETHTLNLSVIVGLSGWLPCSRVLKNGLERSQGARRLAASLPILLCHGEGLALLAFRVAVELDPQGAFMDWNPNDYNPCMWLGVHYVDGQVQILNLNGLSLEGILAPDLGKLAHLRILVLSQNQFFGSIPKEFGELAVLEIMDLRNNSLARTIPTEIEGMPSLKCLLLENLQLALKGLDARLREIRSYLDLVIFDELKMTSTTGDACYSC